MRSTGVQTEPEQVPAWLPAETPLSVVELLSDMEAACVDLDRTLETLRQREHAGVAFRSPLRSSERRLAVNSLTRHQAACDELMRRRDRLDDGGAFGPALDNVKELSGDALWYLQVGMREIDGWVARGNSANLRGRIFEASDRL